MLPRIFARLSNNPNQYESLTRRANIAVLTLKYLIIQLEQVDEFFSGGYMIKGLRWHPSKGFKYGLRDPHWHFLGQTPIFSWKNNVPKETGLPFKDLSWKVRYAPPKGESNPRTGEALTLLITHVEKEDEFFWVPKKKTICGRLGSGIGNRIPL